MWSSPWLTIKSFIFAGVVQKPPQSVSEEDPHIELAFPTLNPRPIPQWRSYCSGAIHYRRTRRTSRRRPNPRNSASPSAGRSEKNWPESANTKKRAVPSANSFFQIQIPFFWSFSQTYSDSPRSRLFRGVGLFVPPQRRSDVLGHAHARCCAAKLRPHKRRSAAQLARRFGNGNHVVDLRTRKPLVGLK